jgi:glycine/D-amino acid oxidase-like deaminating enzyme/nitrite reductase/ring-hydroxylating ferredoxin subunit
MQRDGARTSLWQDKMPDYVSKNTSVQQEIFDVLIVGGGMTGICTGLMLQKAGKSCTVVEAHTLGFGTTGGTTAHLNTFLDSTYDQVINDFGENNAQLLAEATRKALNLISSNIRDHGIECGHSSLPGYLYSQTDDQTKELDKIYEASKTVGIDIEYTNEIPVPIPFEKAVVFANQGQFHPTKYLFGIAKAFEEAGGVIIQNCRVDGVEENDILEVKTTTGIMKARHLIYATHIPPGVNLLHFRCAPYRSYALTAKLKAGNYPEGLAYDMYDPYHYYRTQEVDGELYLIAGGEDHKTAHEENTEACFTRLESHVRTYFDVEEVVHRWSSQFFESADGLAYIGHLPGGAQNMWVATGYSGNGMTYSHIAALVFHDVFVTRESRYVDLFNPNRIKPVAGFSNFVKENADVVVHMIGGYFSHEKLESLSELAHGEAKIVKYEGHRLAIYKDETGKLHAVNPVCPHAKCSVAWNNAEKSWDCPCHGSRFSFDGELLTGPARSDLEKVQLRRLVEEGK